MIFNFKVLFGEKTTTDECVKWLLKSICPILFSFQMFYYTFGCIENSFKVKILQEIKWKQGKGRKKCILIKMNALFNCTNISSLKLNTCFLWIRWRNQPYCRKKILKINLVHWILEECILGASLNAQFWLLVLLYF